MTYVVHYSAFNPIEHHWSPASNKLSSVVFSPLENEDDNCAPALQSGLNTETIRQKEKIVFDGSIKSLSDKYWIDFSYDGFPVNIQPVLVSEDRWLWSC